MIHRQRALLLAIAASGAQAETLFHSHNTNTVITIRQDGEGKTGHQVLDFAANGSITCKIISAEATTSEITAKDITVEHIKYGECTFLGSPTTINTHECHYLFTSSGGGETAGVETGVVHIVCPVGKAIEFGPASCTIHVGSQTLVMTGFHNLGTTAANTTEITIEPAPAPFKFSTTGARCTVSGEGFTGELTTSNMIATGEVDGTTTMTPIWWA